MQVVKLASELFYY